MNPPENQQRPAVSLVLPVYNEEQGLPALYERLKTVLDALEAAEVIFVDDHSTDGTAQVLRSIRNLDARCRYLRLASNRGSHIAILAGLRRARGKCAIFLAADLQDPPEIVPRMLDLWRAGSQVVWAVRAERQGINYADRGLSLAFYFLMNRFGQVAFPPDGADFALLDERVIHALIASAGANPSLGGAIASLGFRQTEIPYRKEARALGVSKWTMGKRLQAFADAFVAFSYMPMRIMSYSGILMAILGFLFAAYITLMRLVVAEPIQGWASIMVAILVLGGMQMTMLGVLGEYIWRTLEEARKRPTYFIEDSAGFQDEEPG